MKVEMEIPEGHQRPRIFYSPGEVIGTLGQEAIDLARHAGVELDDWQQFVMRESCGLNPDKEFYNKYTGRTEQKWKTVENTIVVPRQNGKSALFEARELAGLFLWGEQTIIHSAHRFETSAEQFIRVCNLLEGVPEFDREIKHVSKTHGLEGIFLKSGQRLLFKTRTSMGGRGFSCDCLVMDEAMQLGAASMAALMPTLSAKPNPHIFYGGSAGDQDKQDCSQLGRLRSRALKGIEKAMMFAEWSIDYCNDFCPRDCDEHDDPEDWKSWAKANPSFGQRIDPDFLYQEMMSMGGPRSKEFLVEILSVGDYPAEGEGWRVISEEAWNNRLDIGSAIGSQFCLGVDVAPDRNYACISACGASLGDEELEHVEITGKEDDLDYRTGTSWLARRVIEIWKNQKPGFVVIDKAGHAGGIIDELEQAHVKVIVPNSREVAQACGEFRSAVVPQRGDVPTLVHIGQPPLASALSEASKRKLVDMWAWDKRSSGADISPLVASTLARWGYKKFLYGNRVQEPWVGYLEDLIDN